MNRRALLGVPLAELRTRQHRCPADAVAPGQGAEQHEHVPGTGGGTADQPGVRGEAEAHGVYQAVLLVARLEVDLAADGGDADRVPVMADPGHGPLEQVPRALGLARLAESQ